MKIYPFILLVLSVSFILFGCTGSGTPPASGYGTTSSGGSTSLSSCMAQCTSMPSGAQVLCAQGCYSTAATAAKDANICEPLMGQYNSSLSYSVCLQGVGVALVSTNPCNKLTDPQLKLACMDEIAVETHNADLCSNINYVSAGTDYSNPMVNDSTYTASYQADCRHQVAGQ